MINRRHFLKAASLAAASMAFSPNLTAAQPRSNTKRPNIILIMADDMGYSDLQCYGGEVVSPNLSELADNGLRFTQHYSTGRCWPSRACILTGHYAQHIRRDTLPGIKRGSRPEWAPLLPQMLKSSGYRSYHSGKWHIDGTPADGGFDRSWGGEKTGCDWDRFFDSKPWQEGHITSPISSPTQQYYSTVAIADHAIACQKLHNFDHPDKPFFQYIAFYSPHFPLHALQKDIDAYRDAYKDGWDVIRQRRFRRMKNIGLVNCSLSEPHPDIFPNWNLKPDKLTERIGPGEVGRAIPWKTLTDRQKKFQTDKMAIHAAMITRMDAEIGRIIDHLKKIDAFDNTLILIASDNGASAEQMIRGDGHDKNAPMGSAKTFLCLGPAWATAANTPFRLHKHWNHEGGISSPLIAHWPKGITDKGSLRHVPSHFIDFVPTVLDVTGAAPPALADTAPQRPGKSLKKIFKTDQTQIHDFLWWSHAGHRAIRKGDWKLTARKTANTNEPAWELYDMKTDRSETNNLAQKQPEKVNQLANLWQQTAQKFKNDLNRTKAT
ncbi:MAG: arylsulfatase [Anaerohalosphaera sp.]|nr:arylsulfatase [Anaerohalosphaera sp.]